MGSVCLIEFACTRTGYRDYDLSICGYGVVFWNVLIDGRYVGGVG